MNCQICRKNKTEKIMTWVVSLCSAHSMEQHTFPVTAHKSSPRSPEHGDRPPVQGESSKPTSCQPGLAEILYLQATVDNCSSETNAQCPHCCMTPLSA